MRWIHWGSGNFNQVLSDGLAWTVKPCLLFILAELYTKYICIISFNRWILGRHDCIVSYSGVRIELDGCVAPLLLVVSIIVYDLYRLSTYSKAAAAAA